MDGATITLVAFGAWALGTAVTAAILNIDEGPVSLAVFWPLFLLLGVVLFPVLIGAGAVDLVRYFRRAA